MNPRTFHTTEAFVLESGKSLQDLTIVYHTWGDLNPSRSNVIWICHALTANSNAKEWWSGMIGPGCAFDSSRCFIICANILGSCYGTTGPLSVNPATDSIYGHAFPSITIRDMVNAHELLRRHLNIVEIYLLVGGSMGGYQALEWSLINATVIQNLMLLVTSARESAWGIAIHTTQRMAIEADQSWLHNTPNAGEKGLAVARAIGMLTYRNYQIMVNTQTDEAHTRLDDFKAASYIHHQAFKLVQRFNAFSYYTLTKAMDTHNIARNRSEHLHLALARIQQPTMVIGIGQDLLCPLQEQEFLAQHIPNAQLVKINSVYGHDGFLTETKKISATLSTWLQHQKAFQYE